MQDTTGAQLSRKSGPSARTVDPSEYEPQVVILPEATATVTEEEGDNVAGGPEETTGSGEEAGSSSGGGSSESRRDLTEEDRLDLWIKNLQAMRQRYLASLTELEREKLFKSLEL